MKIKIWLKVIWLLFRSVFHIGLWKSQLFWVGCQNSLPFKLFEILYYSGATWYQLIWAYQCREYCLIWIFTSWSKLLNYRSVRFIIFFHDQSLIGVSYDPKDRKFLTNASLSVYCFKSFHYKLEHFFTPKKLKFSKQYEHLKLTVGAFEYKRLYFSKYV